MTEIIHPLHLPAGLTAFMTVGASFAGDEGRQELAFLGVQQLVTLHQVHGRDIVKVTAANILPVMGTSADGLFTKEKGIALGIRTADCFPVLLAGDEYIAALHCGWRSTVKGIIEKAGSMFEAAGARMRYAWIGAGISRDSFEVKEDFIKTASSFFDPEPYLMRTSDAMFFDLPKLITDKLSAFGAVNIQNAGICTVKDERFYSYRRDPGEKRRMLTVIMKEGIF
jgi:YfiH family protein